MTVTAAKTSSRKRIQDALAKSFVKKSFLLEVLAAVTVMYIQWTPVVLGQGANISVGAQGRYFTPFIILLLPLVANIAKIDLSRQKRLKIATLTLIANFLVAMYLILFHYWGVFA